MVADTFIALLASPWASATILSATCVCAGGSFSATIEKNGTPVTGLSTFTVGTGSTTTAPTGGNTLAIGDSVMVVVAGVSTPPPTNAAIQINLQTSFN